MLPLTRLATRSTAFAVLLVAATAVNLAQFRAIDANTSDHFAAVHRYDTGDIVEIGERDYRAFGEMYGPYLALAELAPGSRVLILRGSRLTRSEFVSRLYGFGLVASIDRVRTDQPLDVDPEPFVIRRGDGGEYGPPWALAMTGPPGAAGEFLLLEWDQPRPGSAHDHQDLLLETSLLPDDLRRELAR